MVLDTILNSLTTCILMMCMLIKTLSCTPKIHAYIANYISMKLKTTTAPSSVLKVDTIQSPSIYIWAHWISSGLCKWSKATLPWVCTWSARSPSSVTSEYKFWPLHIPLPTSALTQSWFHPCTTTSNPPVAKPLTKHSYPSEHAIMLKAGSTRHNCTLHNVAQAEWLDRQ